MCLFSFTKGRFDDAFLTAVAVSLPICELHAVTFDMDRQKEERNSVEVTTMQPTKDLMENSRVRMTTSWVWADVRARHVAQGTIKLGEEMVAMLLQTAFMFVQWQGHHQKCTFRAYTRHVHVRKRRRSMSEIGCDGGTRAGEKGVETS